MMLRKARRRRATGREETKGLKEVERPGQQVRRLGHWRVKGEGVEGYSESVRMGMVMLTGSERRVVLLWRDGGGFSIRFDSE